MKKKILSLVLALVMVIGMIPAAALTAFAAEDSETPVRYYAWNEEHKAVEENYYTGTLSEITSAAETLSGGWYIVNENTDISNTVDIDGDVHIILADDCTLNANGGIIVPDGKSLSIYAQSAGEQMGTLSATGNYSAGIGAWNGENWGNITIHGGNITANGGYNCAGIGGGDQSAGGGTITVYGGKINAEGDINGGAGIGSGYYDITDYDYDDEMIIYEISEQASAGTINICGGEINAKGGDRAAGIGGGYGGDCGNVNVSGGYICAEGGDYADGIGNGYCELEGNFYYRTDTLPVEGGSLKVTGGYIDAYIDTYVIESLVLPEGEPTKWADNTWHVGYTKYAAKAPTCTESGNSDYYKDNYSGSYHSAFPFTDDNLIGGEEALEAWKNGSFCPLGHDWEYTDSTIHTCKRCTLTGEHEDADGDLCCDMCGYSSYYYEYNEETGEFDAKPIPEDAVTVNESTININDGEWAIVTKSCTNPYRINVFGDAHLILANGVTLTATKGITVKGSINIYGATLDESKMGKIHVPAKDTSKGFYGVDNGDAGIGGCNGDYGSKITIHGGAFEVAGGAAAAAIGGGGAIGGVLGPSEDHINCGDVTIYGGHFDKLTAGSGAAGIGSGVRCYMDTLTIKGGTFTEINGGDSGAGIGSGSEGRVDNLIITGGTYGRVIGGGNAAGIGAGSNSYPSEGMGDITITGGNFTTVGGGRSGAGIGSSYQSKCGNINITGGSFVSIHGNGGYSPGEDWSGAAGIGSGAYGHCGEITISGGIFNRILTFEGAAGIGSGYNSKCGNITISGGYFADIFGGYDGPAIGGGAFLNNDMTITVTGGYIRACGNSILDQDARVSPAADIGRSSKGYSKVTVVYGENMIQFSFPSSSNEELRDPATYVSPAKAATCTEEGFKPAYIRQAYGPAGIVSPVAFYSDVVTNVNTWNMDQSYLIGGFDELNEWLETPESEGGGMIPALGHDSERIDEYTHKCQRCGIVEGHADLDSDGKCNACGEVMSPVSYYEYNEETKDFDLKTVDNGVQYLFGNTEDITLDGGCYAVVGEIKAEGNITFDNDTLLILTEGCKLTMSNGKSIFVSAGHHLNICADTLDASTMDGICIPGGAITLKENSSITINGGAFDIYAGYGSSPAAIGSGESSTCGDITINGGSIKAEAHFGAAIGAGYPYADCGTITVNGGDITAISCEGAGIGSGACLTFCSDIIINGGSITATSDGGAGIGSGDSGCKCKNIVINGGEIDAKSENGAAIGSGWSFSSCESITISGGNITAESPNGAAIGTGIDGSTCGKVTISDGSITAESQNGAAIGSGWSFSSCESITISGGSITAESQNGAAIGAGFEDSTCGKVTISDGNVSAYSEKASAIEADEIEISDELYLFAGEDEGKAVAVEKYDGEAYAFICASPVVFNTMSLTLDGSIGVNFFVKVCNKDYVGNNAYMEMKLRNGKTLNVALTDERYDSAKGKYKFTFNVNSLQMAEDITATFHYGDDEEITRCTSVKAYAEYVAENSENPKSQDLANAILTYGYYAQKALQETHGFTLGDDGKYRAMDDPEYIPTLADACKDGYTPGSTVIWCPLCKWGGANYITCPTCNGTGGEKTCPICHGSGISPWDSDEDCGYCYGIGYFLCSKCGGECIIYTDECAACGTTSDIFGYLPSFEMKIDGSDDNITGLSMSLALDNKTDIYLYVTAQTMPEISGVEGATIVKSGDRYKVTIPNIAAHEITKTYTVNIGGYTVEVSAASYIYSVLKSTTRSFNYKCAVAALFDYFISAVIYMN